MEISATDVGVEVEGRPIFRGVDLTITPGSMIALTGPSGCGKTTLLNCLGLIQRISRGSLTVGGSETSGWKDSRRTRFWKDHAAFIYQDYGVIDDESVAYNVTLSKRVSGSTGMRVDGILDSVGLTERGADRAAVLSGGEKQRLGVARAMYKEASIIFADEPTASLDSENRELVISLLRNSVSLGSSVVIATHDAQLAAACDGRYALPTPVERRALSMNTGS